MSRKCGVDIKGRANSTSDSSAASRTLVRDNVERIVVDGGEIEIVRKAARTSSASGETGEGGDTLKVYRAPLPAPQLRARKEIVVAGEPTPQRVNYGLILAIARAKTWTQGFP